MFALCMRYSNTIQDAEDIAIQSFTRVFNKIEECRGENLEAWMKQIFIREAINHYHKNKNQTWTHSSEVDENQNDHGPLVYEALSLEELKHCIAQLPEGCRLVFNLFAIEGFQHKEIGDMLGVSESTSKSQYIRAKSLLQKTISQLSPWKKEVI